MTDRTDTCFQVSMGHNWRESLQSALEKLGGHIVPGETFIEATEVYTWVEFDKMTDADELEQQLADMLNSASYPQIICYHDELFDEEPEHA